MARTGPKMEQQRAPRTNPRPAFRASFEQIAELARQVLRERGLSEEEIERELNRTRRAQS